jgi:hypothetical protein
VNAPSLYPRPAEAIDPRIPMPNPVLSTTPTPGLVDQLNALVGQAEAGDSGFQPIAAAADLDSLGAERIQKLGGIAAADLKAIDAASAKVRAIDEREAALIKGLQDRLGQ